MVVEQLNGARRKAKSILGNTFWFKIIYILYMLISIIPTFEFMLTWILPFMLALGAAYFLYDLLTKRGTFHGKYVIPIYAFLIIIGVTTVMNRANSFSANVNSFVVTSMQILVLSLTDIDSPQEKVQEEIKKIFFVAVIGISLISMASIVTFIFDINGSFDILTKVELRTFHYGQYFGTRLQGVTSGPNVLGGICAIAMSLILLLLTLYPMNKAARGWLIAALVMNFWTLALTSSRGGQLLFLVFLATSCFFIWRKKQQAGNREQTIKRKLSVIKPVAMALACLGVCGALYVGFEPLKGVSRYIPALVSTIGQPDKSNGDQEDILDRVQKYYDYSSPHDEFSDPDTGRTPIWRAGIDVITRNPLTGVGKLDAIEYAKQIENVIPYHVSHFHNIFIETAACYGLPALAVLLWLLIWVGWDGLMSAFKNKGSLFVVFFFLLFIAYIARDMVEASMLYSKGFFPSMFALILGYTMYFLQEGKPYKPNLIERGIGKLTQSKKNKEGGQ